MGVSLSYVTIEPVEPTVRASVSADARRINGERRWWCEALHFFDWPGYEGHLAGSTKLFLPGYSTENGEYVEVDPADDCFMAARDAQFIGAQLARWSGEHGIEWRLEIEGNELGTICNGEISDELRNMINELPLLGAVDPMAMIGEMESLDIDDHARAQDIDRRYSSRWA